MQKTVLLIAGGGTLGTYTSKELLRLGHKVDIVCLEDHVSDNPNLRFFKARATIEYLTELFQQNHYDGIVNFIHYPNPDDYIPYHELLSRNTEHLIFLSSYRIYADLEHPIRETSPQLMNVLEDPEFFAHETYALSKSKCEVYLNNNTCPKNWTVVRPVISFSFKRLDINMVSGHRVVDAAKNNVPVTLPLEAKHLTAGLDWAGNSGKLIANLLFKPGTIGEAYTISSGQNLKWEQIADYYTEFLGVRFNWEPANFPANTFHWDYDRAYDRVVDNTKVLQATGLTKADFTPIKEGIRIELTNVGAIQG